MCRISDATGISQHAAGSTLDPAHGHCTDDVARALQADLLQAASALARDAGDTSLRAALQVAADGGTRADRPVVALRLPGGRRLVVFQRAPLIHRGCDGGVLVVAPMSDSYRATREIGLDRDVAS